MTGNKWDELLAENKEQYNQGILTREVYERNAKRLRRQRRNELKSTGETVTIGQPSESPSKKPRKKKAGRKPVVEITPDMEATEKLIYDYFKEINLAEEDFVPSTKSWHCTSIVALMSAMKSNPEIHPGQLMLDKFKAKWLRDPEFFVSHKQGGILIFGLGPILLP